MGEPLLLQISVICKSKEAWPCAYCAVEYLPLLQHILLPHGRLYMGETPAFWA